MLLPKTLLASVLLLFFVQKTTAQEIHYCGFDLVLQKLADREDGFQEACTEIHHQTVRAANDQQRSSELYEIQVVFHVVHNTEAQNLPDEVILNQMEILNADYRRLNPDAENTRDIFLPIAADTHIQFVLASEDPDGNPTNGINRVETDRSSFEFDLLSQDITVDEVKFSETGGADAWDPDRYLNIWVCNITATLGAQIFGFAYPPLGAPNWEGFFTSIPEGVEGVVVHYTTVGSNNPSAGDDNFSGNEGGRTLTHEVGHYLGLRHTWGDAFFNGCGSDDGIEDTPNISSNNNFSCNFDLNTCTEIDGEDFPDMGENYMDYNQDNCVNMFTQGQVDAMRFALENFRPELIEGQVSVAERANPALNAFPNPTQSHIRLEVNSGAEVHLFDSGGKLLNVWNKLPANPLIDLSGVAPGFYLLQVDHEGGRSNLRVIRQ